MQPSPSASFIERPVHARDARTGKGEIAVEPCRDSPNAHNDGKSVTAPDNHRALVHATPPDPPRFVQRNALLHRSNNRVVWDRHPVALQRLPKRVSPDLHPLAKALLPAFLRVFCERIDQPLNHPLAMCLRNARARLFYELLYTARTVHRGRMADAANVFWRQPEAEKVLIAFDALNALGSIHARTLYALLHERPMHLCGASRVFDKNAVPRLARPVWPINLATPDRSTLLRVAVIDGAAPLVNHLLAFGADPSLADAEGGTALHWVAMSGSGPSAEDKAKVLLCLSPDVDAQDHEGRTALHLAARHNAFEVATLLFAAGAQLAVVDNEGRSALEYLDEDNDRDEKNDTSDLSKANAPSLSAGIDLEGMAEDAAATRRIFEVHTTHDSLTESLVARPVNSRRQRL
jgi:Ankyrin repeats (3 copies)